MKIKKYTALTLKEATELMKEELGGEAIVLSTRVFEKKTPSGKQKIFEITSGIEEELEKLNRKESSSDIFNKSNTSFESELKKLQDKIEIGKRSNQGIKKHKEGLIVINPNKNQSSKYDQRELDSIFDKLLDREIEKPIISSILNQFKQTYDFMGNTDFEDYFLTSISSLISTSNFEITKKGKQKTVCLVGPTGVGKTTCIAKLAAISKILHNLDIGIISIDTYRLGAIDQLRIFSEVSNIDMLVAYEPSEMPGLVKKFKGKDIIFIDTAGRGQKNISDLKKAKQFLDTIKIDETYLTLSATSSTKNLEDVAKKFKLFDYNSMIFTKIDEGVAFGNILNVVVNSNKPVIYLTNGQMIPDDIISADSEFIAKMVYTGKIPA
ncbi:MAG: flagellar biosynthesis protein FlhF [Melioribacteraceae bacterium]|nr:flagellar biosynthesis protein FlhF [Melioribacteraceae bacterium]